MSTGFSALTEVSQNSKTGPIAVSSSGWSTCPSTCGAREVCYAMKGYHTRLHGDAITREDRGLPAEQFIKKVAALRPGTFFRHNVGGDLWHHHGKVVPSLLLSLASATQHLTAAWTYTHHRPDPRNQKALRQATDLGFTVNVSTETLDDAVKYHRRGYPVTCIVKDMPKTFVHKGVTFVRCQHQVDNGQTQCSGCGQGKPLCAQAGRDFVVAFEQH
jgi:hypothetical protein